MGLFHQGPLLQLPRSSISKPVPASRKAGQKEDTRVAHLRKPLSGSSNLTVALILRVKSNPMSFREPKGKMELQDLLGPPDHLGPEALLVTLGKTAPEELKAQR